MVGEQSGAGSDRDRIGARDEKSGHVQRTAFPRGCECGVGCGGHFTGSEIRRRVVPRRAQVTQVLRTKHRQHLRIIRRQPRDRLGLSHGAFETLRREIVGGDGRVLSTDERHHHQRRVFHHAGGRELIGGEAHVACARRANDDLHRVGRRQLDDALNHPLRIGARNDGVVNKERARSARIEDRAHALRPVLMTLICLWRVGTQPCVTALA